MKNLFVFAMVAMVLIIFNGCQKDEPGVSQMADDVQPQAVVKPDVYVENGYLVVRDLYVADSLIQVLDNMTFSKRANWDQSIGFLSAISYYSKIFQESEKIKSLEEMIDFRTKYHAKLKWSENEDDFSFDYPFYETSLLPILNKDGLLKIGRSLYKYDTDKRIIILDGDINQLGLASNLTHNTNNIIISKERNENLKSSDTDVTQITNFAGQYGQDSHPNDEWCEWSSSRRMKTYLNFETFKYTTNLGTWQAGYRINTWQKAQKKSWGVWVNYYVHYRIGNILYKENATTIYQYSGSYTTGSIKPSYTYTTYSEITIYSPDEPSLSSITQPYPIYFSCFSTNEDMGNYYPFQLSYSD